MDGHEKNTINLIIGSIETYEDELFGYKAFHEGIVAIKDLAWSSRLSWVASLLPSLQEGLPVPDQYKQAVKDATNQVYTAKVFVIDLGQNEFIN